MWFISTSIPESYMLWWDFLFYNNLHWPFIPTEIFPAELNYIITYNCNKRIINLSNFVWGGGRKLFSPFLKENGLSKMVYLAISRTQIRSSIIQTKFGVMCIINEPESYVLSIIISTYCTWWYIRSIFVYILYYITESCLVQMLIVYCIFLRKH